MRAIWKGSISFSLVNIPISLYPAIRREELKFRFLRKKDLSPVNYKRVAEADGREVPWEEIFKGYEYEKGKFVVLEEGDFRRADIEATQTVEIVEFVPLEEIDPMFFDKPYYLEPQKNGAKAYALLREALKRSSKVGIAKVVIKTRQHLASIKPEDDALVLELMHFAEELVEPSALQIPGNLELGARELEMATELAVRRTGLLARTRCRSLEGSRLARFPIFYGVLSAQKAGDGLASISQPQQSQTANDQDLADHRKAVDQEGQHATNNRCFGQI
jgi:DNA end-binding protein Ku